MRRIAMVTLAFGGAAMVVSAALAAQPQSWPPLTDAQAKQIEQAAPDKPLATPAKPRKVLVYGRVQTHGNPVRWCFAAMEILGKTKDPEKRPDKDYAVSWVRPYGPGACVLLLVGPCSRPVLQSRGAAPLLGRHPVCHRQPAGRGRAGEVVLCAICLTRARARNRKLARMAEPGHG